MLMSTRQGLYDRIERHWGYASAESYQRAMGTVNTAIHNCPWWQPIRKISLVRTLHKLEESYWLSKGIYDRRTGRYTHSKEAQI